MSTKGRHQVFFFFFTFTYTCMCVCTYMSMFTQYTHTTPQKILKIKMQVHAKVKYILEIKFLIPNN